MFGNHLCDVTCCKLSRKADCKNDLVVESGCLYLKDVLMKIITNFDMNCMSRPIHVLLEIQERFDITSGRDLLKLKFKIFSTQAKAQRRATEGSVAYDFYSTEKVVIFPQTCKPVATDITLLPPPGISSRVPPCSSMALKNSNIGGSVIDSDYWGNLKVVIMNHSTDLELSIEVGDRIAQFILTRFEAPNVIGVSELDSTARGSGSLGSTGH